MTRSSTRNRTRTRSALLLAAVTGATILAPAVAGADPQVDITAGGQSATNGWTALAGDPIVIAGTGCVNPVAGQPAYMGEFASTAGDPLAAANGQVFENQTAADGSFTLDPQAPSITEFELAGNTTTFGARFYCSTRPLTSFDSSVTNDPSVLWVSPAWTMTLQLEAPPTLRQARAAQTSLKLLAARGAQADPGPAVRYDIDPDALPAVDRVDITGPKAARLKATVDARATLENRLGQLLTSLLSRRPKAPTPISDQDYVRAAFRSVGEDRPSNASVARMVGLLDAGHTKVEVVETIALTEHDAAWWNRRL